MGRVALLVLVLCLFAGGLALGHAVNCFTADPGQGTFTVYCGPKVHILPDQWGFPDGYDFETTVGVTQSVYGSFDWNELRITNAHDNTGDSQFGILFLEDFVNQGAPPFASETWRCQPTNFAYAAIVSYPLYHNASTQGAWEMRSSTGGDCLNPLRQNHDYMVVNAY